jgi:dephospho-CoA kinase
MRIIGLVGGIASGKSTVAAELAALGATVLEADAAAHQALELPEVKEALVARWGEGILEPSGQVSRSAVARRVFSSKGGKNTELQFLETLLHPLVRRQFEGELARLEAERAPAAVIDAPLLLEAGWEDLCDSVVFVDAPTQERLKRVSRRNWNSAEYARREAAQMPIEEKRRRASHVLPNFGTRNELREAVREFWKNLQSGTDRQKST